MRKGPPPKPNLSRQLTRRETEQLQQTRETALRLAAQSELSFRRGLLPLNDYLRQVSLADTLQESVSGMGVGDRQQTLTQNEVARYRGIVQQLERFNQPASQGWAADLALAQSYLARAEAKAAFLAKEDGALTSALNRQFESARRHAQLRRFDESLGMAAPQDVIEAFQLERRAELDAQPSSARVSEYETAFRAYRDQLQTVAQQVEAWSNRGAGIGREDRLHHARYQLAQADAILAGLNQNTSAQKAALKTAETELSALFRSQQEFSTTGTASLFDLARTWSDRDAIYRQARDPKAIYSTASLATHALNFELLETRSNQTFDNRGRIAADREFIAALKAETNLRALKKQLSDPFHKDGS